MNGVGWYATQGVGTMSGGSNGGDAGSRQSQSLDDVLGKDAFLRLLTTQLRYQDPLKPIDDQDFIAQMAQFSALEQMQNMTRSLERFLEYEQRNAELSRATSLLGRVVEVQGASTTYVGKVEAIRMVDGLPRLVVEGMLFELRDVVQVMDESSL